MENRIVELRDVSKSFGKVRALKNVDFFVDDAEVVGLIGDNGAGKSTLIKIVSGVHAPDSGEVSIYGQKMDQWSVAAARQSGIETVYQDRALAVQQTISRNIFMGRELIGFLGFLKTRQQRADADGLMRDIGFTSKVFSPDSVVATLSGGERQGVAISRALHFDANLIILDEPTTALSLTESEKVFRFVRTIKEQGSSAIFISHNIYHSYDVADRFVILDRGRVVMEANKEDVPSADKLVRDLQIIARTGRAEHNSD
jgi:simple sugar transport system ATP-binding protein